MEKIPLDIYNFLCVANLEVSDRLLVEAHPTLCHKALLWVVCITCSLTFFSMKPGEFSNKRRNFVINRKDQRISCVSVCVHLFTLNSIAVDNYIGERYTDYYRLVCITTKALIAPVIFNV